MHIERIAAIANRANSKRFIELLLFRPAKSQHISSRRADQPLAIQAARIARISSFLKECPAAAGHTAQILRRRDSPTPDTTAQAHQSRRGPPNRRRDNSE